MEDSRNLDKLMTSVDETQDEAESVKDFEREMDAIEEELTTDNESDSDSDSDFSLSEDSNIGYVGSEDSDWISEPDSEDSDNDEYCTIQ